jgi:hypothetical protein
MPATQSADQVLERHYLELRCGILDLAAALDRIERADGSGRVAEDPRMSLIQEGLTILQTSGTDRAERVQLLFSDEYEEGWNRKDNAT